MREEEFMLEGKTMFRKAADIVCMSLASLALLDFTGIYPGVLMKFGVPATLASLAAEAGRALCIGTYRVGRSIAHAAAHPVQTLRGRGTMPVPMPA